MYLPEDITKLENERSMVAGKADSLALKFMARTYKTSLGWEHATQGFGRRLRTLARAIENVYVVTPPARTEHPTSDERIDLGINLQAFVFNVFGAIDNLAWIWVAELPVVELGGKPLRPQWIGLRSNHEFLRSTLSPTFRARLETFDPWLQYQEGFRHALGHRVPLYVPPYILFGEKQQSAYDELEERKNEAMRRKDYDVIDQLNAQQDALGVFKPLMSYVSAEDPKTVPYLSQILCDFHTVEELGLLMLRELDSTIS
jgi:hypothetical protein